MGVTWRRLWDATGDVLAVRHIRRCFGGESHVQTDDNVRSLYRARVSCLLSDQVVSCDEVNQQS